MVKVSIIVPVYNVEKYIKKCLDSLVNQTLKDIEIIVVNDGSKDGSLAIVEEYALNNEVIKVYTKENGGLSDARNFGLKYVDAEYVVFIDSDDYIDLTMLEKMYYEGRKYDADIVCCDLMYVKNDVLSVSIGGYEKVVSFKEDKNIIGINNSACNKLFKTSFLSDKTFDINKLYEDMAVIPYWLSLANKVVYVNEALYFYLQREGSIVHSLDDRVFDIYWAIDKSTKLIKENFPEINIDDQVNRLYLNNGLIMTTLRIKQYDNDEVKLEFIKKNMELLEKHCPNWYSLAKKGNYSFKQKIVFYILKNKMYSLLFKLYKRG